MLCIYGTTTTSIVIRHSTDISDSVCVCALSLPSGIEILDISKFFSEEVVLVMEMCQGHFSRFRQ